MRYKEPVKVKNEGKRKENEVGKRQREAARQDKRQEVREKSRKAGKRTGRQ